jgi:hypothetical protein
MSKNPVVMTGMKAHLPIFCVLLALLTPGAQADALEDGFTTVWESLWHQSGLPSRIYRWEGPEVSFRIRGENLSTHRDQALTALQAVSQASGIRMVEVGDATTEAQLELLVVTPQALADNEPCVTRREKSKDWKLERVTVTMRTTSAWRCMHHEMMHAMGIVGHPSGNTALSYFGRQDMLQPMDKTMLKAWYAPAMRPGMGPFEALVILADAVVQDLGADKPEALASRDRFFARTMTEMQNFALGQGEVPTILKRSGKSNDAGMRLGQTEMRYFVGMAYQQGATVHKDRSQALLWFQRAAEFNQSSAQILMARALESGKDIAQDLPEAYKWFSLAAAQNNPFGRPGAERVAVRLTAEQLAEAQTRVAAFK